LFGQAHADTVQYVYDELGRLAATVESTGEVRFYKYDAAGNLLSVSSASASEIAILSLTPGHGIVGSSVTIVGSGFIADPLQNTVRFAGTQASVTSATATTIVATVPVGAASGPISVTNTKGTATSAAAYSVVAAPTIAAAAPDTVSRGFITRVDVTGSNLAFANAVTFAQAGITASITSGASDQRLPINLSVSAAVPSGSYGFTVTNAAGTASSGAVVITVGATTAGVLQSVSPVTTVFLPFPALTAPSGAATSVAPPVSVSMP
jgi:YD repeat-containing protein